MATLHGVSLSQFVRKVLVALAEKGIEYEQVPVLPFGQTPEFMAIAHRVREGLRAGHSYDDEVA